MNKREIGNRLRECRGSRTMAEVAKALDISLSAVAMYERGERIPRDDVKKKFAKYYRKSIMWLFYAD